MYSKKDKDMILVTGCPRSGTSWMGKVLGFSDDVTYYYEPDNEHNSLLGYIFKQKLHRFPYLRASSNDYNLYHIFNKTIADLYLYDYSKISLIIKKLFHVNLKTSEKEVERKNPHFADLQNQNYSLPLSQKLTSQVIKILYSFFALFTSYNKHQKLPLIKSVHSLLAIPYLQKHIKSKVVIILRHPAAIVASNIRLNNPDIFRNIFIQKDLVADYLQPYIQELTSLTDPLEKAAAQIAIMYYVINQQLKNNPDWIVIRYEPFCQNPVKSFKNLYKSAGLPWTDEISDKIHSLNKKGEGYTTKRIAKKQIDKWRKELTYSDIQKIQKGYGIIPPAYYKGFLSENFTDAPD